MDVALRPQIGFNPEEIEALDLTQFRNSDLPTTYYFLLLVPVIGWIALCCLKYNYVTKHQEGEKHMQQVESTRDLSVKIYHVTAAIKESGPLGWQYQLDLARLYLLDNQYIKASIALIAFKNHVGDPEQSGWNNVRNKGLVSFKPLQDGFIYVDHEFVMHVDYHNGPQALLNAAVLAAREKYVEAYDAYNEVIFYEGGLSNSRKHQATLVEAMIQVPGQLNPRGREIIKAERPAQAQAI